MEITIDELKDKVGHTLGTSEWVEISQSMIDKFADLTGDHQFIHVDPVKAKATPFGTTIAHGFLTVSMLASLGASALPTVKGRTMAVNYGFDKLRMTSPVKSGSRIRGVFVLKSIDAKSPKQHQLVYTVTVEIEGSEKPALVADWVTQVFT